MEYNSTSEIDFLDQSEKSQNSNSPTKGTTDSASQYTGLEDIYNSPRYKEQQEARSKQEVNTIASLGKTIGNLYAQKNRNELDKHYREEDLKLQRDNFQLNRDRFTQEVREYDNDQKKSAKLVADTKQAKNTNFAYSTVNKLMTANMKSSNSFQGGLLSGHDGSLELAEGFLAQNLSKKYGNDISVGMYPHTTDFNKIDMDKAGSPLFDVTVYDKNNKPISTEKMSLDIITNITKSGVSSNEVAYNHIQNKEGSNNDVQKLGLNAAEGKASNSVSDKYFNMNDNLKYLDMNEKNYPIIREAARLNGANQKQLADIDKKYSKYMQKPRKAKNISNESSTISGNYITDTTARKAFGQGIGANGEQTKVKVDNSDKSILANVHAVRAKLNEYPVHNSGIVEDGYLVYKEDSNKIHVTKEFRKLSPEEAKHVIYDRGDDNPAFGFMNPFKNPIYLSYKEALEAARIEVGVEGKGFFDTLARNIPLVGTPYMQLKKPTQEHAKAVEKLANKWHKQALNTLTTVDNNVIRVYNEKEKKLEFYAKNGYKPSGLKSPNDQRATSRKGEIIRKDLANNYNKVPLENIRPKDTY